MPVLIRGNPLLDVYNAGVFVNHRPAINFVGATVADNEASDRVDVTVGGTWTTLQIFNAGIQLAAGSCLKDSGGVDRLCINAASPHLAATGDLDVSNYAAIGPGAAIGSSGQVLVLSSNETRSQVGGILNIVPAVVANGSAGTWDTMSVAGIFTFTGFTGIVVRGVAFAPIIKSGTILSHAAIVASLRFLTTPVITTARGLQVNTSGYSIGAGSGSVRGVDVANLGAVNFAAAYGLYVADQTASPIRYLAELLGLSSTNLRVVAGDPPDAALATQGDSNVYAAYMENGVVNLRQKRWKTFATLVAGDMVQTLT